MSIKLGTISIKPLYLGSTKLVKGYKGSTLFYSASRLPSAFQEVEYLESTETQYIDTEYQMKDMGKIECEIQNTIPSSVRKYNGFCGQYSPSTSAQIVQNYESGIFSMRWLNSSKTAASDTTTFHYFSISKTQLVMDNSTTSISQSNLGSTLSILLFRRRTNEGSVDLGNDNTGYWKCKYVKIYDTNDILVRNFVPCYRKADNVAGLYDLVNGVFYTNAGTGNFIVGGNV